MRMSLRLVMGAAILLAGVASLHAQSADPRVADLVRAGKVRIGMFPPQYTKDLRTGELKGPYVEVMRIVAAHVGVEPVMVELPTPAKLVECLGSGACDIGSLGFDPTRAEQVGGFTPAFMQMDYTLLVPRNSAIRSGADMDRPGIRIAVVRNHASTLALGRIVKQAEQVTAETPDAAFDLIRGGKVDAWASVRPALLGYAAGLPGSRVLDDSYGANFPAFVVPKGQDARLAFLSDFVEDAKASGLMARAIERGDQPGYRVAAPGKR